MSDISIYMCSVLDSHLLIVSFNLHKHHIKKILPLVIQIQDPSDNNNMYIICSLYFLTMYHDAFFPTKNVKYIHDW